MKFTFIVRIQQWLKAHPVDALLMLAVGLAGLLTGLWARAIIKDDALITFRVAENLAHGHGFVYNLGEWVQVTTTPLYAMVLAIGTWFFGSAPPAALVLNLTLSVLIPILAYDVGRRLAGRITGVGGAILLTMMPLLIIAFSMESYLFVTLILASMDAYVARRYQLAGILVGLTAVVRGDAALLGASMLIYDSLANRRLRWRLIIPAMAIPAGWYLFATFYYGWPFPATLGAKTAQGTFDWLGERFVSGFLEYWEEWIEDYSLRFYLFPVLIIVGLLPVIRSERLWLILILHDILHVATFEGLGVTFAEWYYAPLMPGIALLTARGVQVIADGVAHLFTAHRQVDQRQSGVPGSGLPNPRVRHDFSPGGKPSRTRLFISTSIAAILIFVLLVTIYPVSRAIIATNPDWKARVYPEAGRWIANNTNASANLATIDIGHLGYWSNRYIIDIVGLAQPDVSPHIARGDFGYAIRHYQPDMILIGALWLPEVQNTDWFQAAYVPRHGLKFKDLNEPLILFTRREGVNLKTDTIPPTEIQPLKVDFNRQITLTGYHLKQPVLPGGHLNLTLFWQVEAPIEVDFTVFVQMVDANDNIKAQGDSKPQRGFYGTPHWQPGEQVVDSYTLPIGKDVSPDNYDILLGFYEADNGSRLQILDEAGVFKSDHVRLTGVQIQAP